MCSVIREQWGQALEHRQQYLEMQISTLSNKISHQSPSEHDDDVEREQALINQWVALTEERNAVCIPAPNSNIPGAQADWWVCTHNSLVLLDL
jgi:kinesin family protein 13